MEEHFSHFDMLMEHIELDKYFLKSIMQQIHEI